MIEREDEVNWSSLKSISISPKHYRWNLTHPRKDSEAFLRGRVIHTMVYEPDKLASRYVIMPRFHGGQNDDTAIKNGFEGGKQAKAEWCAANSAAEIVPDEVYQACLGMRASLLGDPIAAQMIVGGYAEQLVTWTDEETGIECRGRVDHVNGSLSDLKSTRNIARRAFMRDVVKFQYVSQLAFYADGLAANGVQLEGVPCIIAVENVAPYDVMVVEFNSAAIAAGRKIYRECLDRLLVCRETDTWPGVAGGERVSAELPEWMKPAQPAITMGGVDLF